MAEFTISPIPYGGGTLNWNNTSLDLVRINNTRYIYAFSQSSPNYKFYGIADVANITGSTPTVSIIKQRAFTGQFTSVRLVPLDNDRFVSYDGADLFVYNTSTDDVVEELKIANYGNDYGNVPATRTFAVKIANDVILEARVVADVPPTTYKVSLRKLTYDTGTSTFTISTDIDIATGLSNTFTNESYIEIKPIVTNPNKWIIVFYRNSNYTDWSTLNLQKIAIYDSSTNSVDDITPTNVSDFAGGNVIGFDVNAIILFDNNSTDAIQYDGSNWSTPFTYAASSVGARIVTTGAFSSAYGILIRKEGGTYAYNEWFYRIVNYQGPSNVVTSFPTNSDDGILVTYPSNFAHFYKKQAIDIYDPETFLVNGYNSTATDKQFIVLRYKP